MQFDTKIFWMMPMPICVVYSSLMEIPVQLFTVLNVQLVMSFLLIFLQAAFHVLVAKCS